MKPLLIPKSVCSRTLLIFVGTVLVSGFCRGETQPADFELPARLRNLTDLALLHAQNRMNQTQKTDVLLVWLREERAHPSLTGKGYGGGEITSDYIQTQLVKALAQEGNPLVLQAIAPDAKADPCLRDAACMALAFRRSMRTPKVFSPRISR